MPHPLKIVKLLMGATHIASLADVPALGTPNAPLNTWVTMSSHIISPQTPRLSNNSASPRNAGSTWTLPRVATKQASLTAVNYPECKSGLPTTAKARVNDIATSGNKLLLCISRIACHDGAPRAALP